MSDETIVWNLRTGEVTGPLYLPDDDGSCFCGRFALGGADEVVSVIDGRTHARSGCDGARLHDALSAFDRQEAPE